MNGILSKLNPNAIVECVPNFSEGEDFEKMKQVVLAMRVDGVRLLDWSMDLAHNRTVITVAGSPNAVVEAAVRAVGKAAELVDLTRQTGTHPRIGAADVVPFVPVSGISLAECAMLARHAGLQIWERFQVPVYFYEAAATRPDRVNLEDVRRGQFEALRTAVMKDARRAPDVGGPALHHSAGASAVGARRFLIAYNVYLQPTSAGVADISAARAIARDIRASNGGLQGVKALGMLVHGRAQVSMNITDFQRTPMRQVYEAIERIARAHGAKLAEGEMIGLIPAEAYEPESDWVRQMGEFDPAEKVLERKLEHPLEWPEL